MIDVEPLILSELDRMFPLPDGGRADWNDVLARSQFAGQPKRWRWRPVLVAAVVLAGLVGVGVAIAATFGAFNGISAAQHPPTAADKLDPGVAASIAAHPELGIELRSARFITQFADGIRIYAVATKTGDLCVVAERLPNNNGKNDASVTGCGSPLTQADPITASSFQPNQGTPPISWGFAIDGVTAVSFMVDGQEVTVPVNNNVWAYEGESLLRMGSYTVHFKDGHTETPPGASRSGMTP